MKATWIRNAMLGTLILAGTAGAKAAPVGDPVPVNDRVLVNDKDLASKVLHEIRMYPRYSVFDDIKFRVSNGNLALLGEVTQPYKKSDLGNILGKVSGVVAVDNELRVAPLSSFDDRLRLQVANAIYRDPFLSRYGMGVLPSIHILVDNGHVTLEGIVDDEAARNIAGMRASTGLGFGPVTNNLQVVTPATSKRS